MAGKLPPPDPAHLSGLDPPVHTLDVGTDLARIYVRGGEFPTTWNALRHFGPIPTSRFDHHELDREGMPHKQYRGVIYAADHLRTCIAEYFQDSRVVDVRRRDPYLVAYKLTYQLDLLDLTGVFVTRMGASTAIHSGTKSLTQAWARALYDAYPRLHGIAYCSSMNGNARAYVLNERALVDNVFPAAVSSHHPLHDLTIALRVDSAASELHYSVIGR
jgi:hypothetical protein